MQFQATCFDAIGDVIHIYTEAAGDSTKSEPEHCADEEMAGRVASYIAAMPFTARLTVAADGWKESMQATVQLLAPTSTPAGVLHPLKPLVAMAPGSGACPPIHLEDTFSQGLGLTQAYGSAFECFRCVIKFEDDTVDSVQDGRVQRVQRQIRCACVAPGHDAPAHAAELTGEAYLVERFGKLPKESYAHALLA